MLRSLWASNGNKQSDASDNDRQLQVDKDTDSDEDTTTNSHDAYDNDYKNVESRSSLCHEADDMNIAIEWRIVIFIRHGNSIWNESTDTISTPYSAAKAITAFTSGLNEYAKLKWSASYKHEESIYVDTPLSPKGMKQAYNLNVFLTRHEHQREQQKMHYLQQHQCINSPIKDAWRSLQQHKLQCEHIGKWQRAHAHQNNGDSAMMQSSQFSPLCDDAIASLTTAMHHIEQLMTNATPHDANATRSDMSIVGDTRFSTHNEAMDIAFVLDIICGKNMPSKIVTSNLRRAISTCVLSLWFRLKMSSEKIYILSCLQEIGINVDTLTDTRQFQVPQVSNAEMQTEHLDSKALNEFYASRIETIYNYGSKVSNSFFMESLQNSQQRLKLFADWIFMTDHDAQHFIDDAKSQHTDENSNDHKNGFKTKKITPPKQQAVPPAIIAVGHSKWIKEFFKTYLPPTNADFIGKRKKLNNCGVVAFKFAKIKQKYVIAPDSITCVYKGFGANY